MSEETKKVRYNNTFSPFKIVSAWGPWDRTNSDGVVKNLCSFMVEGRKEPIHMSAKQFEKNNQGIALPVQLIGSTINVSFYQKGQKFNVKDADGNDTCTESNKIVDSFAFELSLQEKIAKQVAEQIAASMGFASTPAAPVAAAAPVEEEEIEDTSKEDNTDLAKTLDEAQAGEETPVEEEEEVEE